MGWVGSGQVRFHVKSFHVSHGNESHQSEIIHSLIFIFLWRITLFVVA